MNTHTPGPWKVDGDLIVAGDGTDVIGSIDLPSNARLIAATPDLLEALKSICDASADSSQARFSKAVSKARAAIAKATK